MTARKTSTSPLLNGCQVGLVGSYVYRPLNVVELCPPTRMSNDHLRRAMELDRCQFNSIVSILRYLANCTLDNVYWEDQDAEKREMFIAKACNECPILRTKYEDSWPIEVYMTRYLDTKVRLNRPARRRPKRQGGPDRSRGSLALQNYVMKPLNMNQLQDSKQSKTPELQKAMQCGQIQFNKMRLQLEELIRNNLDITQSYDDQDRYLKALFTKKAMEIEPLYSTRYEDAWPIHTYAARYLGQIAFPGRDSAAVAFQQTANSEDLGGENVPDTHLALPAFDSFRSCTVCNVSSAGVQASSSTSMTDTWIPTVFPSNPSSSMSSPQVLGSAPAETRYCAEPSLSSAPPVAYTHIPRTSSHPLSSSPAPVWNRGAETAPPLLLPPPNTEPQQSLPHPSEPVRDFLRSVKPNLEHLLARFEKMGINNEESLSVLKSWPPEYLERFLKTHLNPFQVAAVQFLLLDS